MHGKRTRRGFGSGAVLRESPQVINRNTTVRDGCGNTCTARSPQFQEPSFAHTADGWEHVTAVGVEVAPLSRSGDLQRKEATLPRIHWAGPLRAGHLSLA